VNFVSDSDFLSPLLSKETLNSNGLDNTSSPNSKMALSNIGVGEETETYKSGHFLISCMYRDVDIDANIKETIATIRDNMVTTICSLSHLSLLGKLTTFTF
jgi:hypothetical protein